MAQTVNDLVAEAVARSLPNPDRPRMAAEVEARLAPLEAKQAVTYSNMETLTAQFNNLAAVMESEDSAVPRGQFEDEDSLVINIRSAREKLIKP